MKGKTKDLEIDAPKLLDSEIEAAAAKLRREYFEFLSLRPACRIRPDSVVWDYLDPCERLSLDLECDLGSSIEGHRIAGLMTVLDIGGKISIDESVVQLPLYPFTVAHELGHWTLHRASILERWDRLKQLGIDWGGMPSLRRDLDDANTAVNMLETQANRFATHLLMPDDMTRHEFRLRFGTYSKRYVDRCTDSPAFARDHRDFHQYARFMAHGAEMYPVVPMNEEFGVSIDAMAYRLRDLALV